MQPAGELGDAVVEVAAKILSKLNGRADVMPMEEIGVGSDENHKRDCGSKYHPKIMPPHRLRSVTQDELSLRATTSGVRIMATFAKCTDEKGRTLWVNLDNVTTMQWRDIPSPGNEIIFIGGALVVVREQPEQLAKQV